MKNYNEIKKILESLELNIQKCKVLLDGGVPNKTDGEHFLDVANDFGNVSSDGQSKIVEGVFDGQQMVGPDGKLYSISANYISKSKLVEGDMLKLTIDPNGNFVYKQIGPVERERRIGTLIKDEASEDFVVNCGDDQNYKVILASVTYFKAKEGDQVVVLVPKGANSTWAAVENVIKN